MSLGPEVRELLDAVALGTASREEILQAEEMAAVNPVIARELDALHQAVGVLATDVPIHTPPASLKRTVMDEIHADVAASTPPAQRRGLFGFSLIPTLAAAASVVAIALLAGTLLLNGSDDTALPRVVVNGSVEAPDARADVAVVDGDTVVITATGLPMVGPARGYEVWLLGDDAPISAGFLAGDEELVLASAVDTSTISGIAVTEEPRTNTVAPTTPILLQADLPSA